MELGKNIAVQNVADFEDVSISEQVETVAVEKVAVTANA